MKKIKWGIMAAGGIAHKFADDFRLTQNTELAAIGSRSLDKAQEFAKKYNIPKAFGSYEELAEDKDIDLIYVATPHAFHKENVMLCLKNKKAVLCEKSFTLNAKEAEEVIIYAREQKIFLMEAMWTRYLPAVKKAVEWLNSGIIGDVNILDVSFGYKANFDPLWRLYNPNLAGGALLDVGIYPISFISMIFKRQPAEIKSICKMSTTGVDEDFSAIFGYESGKIAKCMSAFSAHLPSSAWIIGTNGWIEIKEFWMAKCAILSVYGQEPVVFNDPTEGMGYNFEIQEATDCLLNGKLESKLMPLDETLAIMKTMDKMRKQWNFTYPMER